MPRRPSSQDGKDNKKAAKTKPKNSDEASPPPPEDLDEKLIFDAFKAACSYVNTIIAAETVALSIDDAPKVEVEAEAPKGKGKGGKKSRSPSAKPKSPKGKKGKKGDKEEAPAPVVVELTEEEKSKKALKDKMKKEYLAAIKKEGLLD